MYYSRQKPTSGGDFDTSAPSAPELEDTCPHDPEEVQEDWEAHKEEYKVLLVWVFGGSFVRPRSCRT
ncbi:hypothetical protein L218DRAFT_966447 [Marasmius fiardii PR-910]|nr:hypothetical protein L218DRAFT_966447 [Marasmius fiardii PR-910]